MIELAICYFLFSFLYFIQQKCVFIRKNEIAVFNRKIQNITAPAPCIYYLKNVAIQHKRQTENTLLSFPLFATREVDGHKIQFMLSISANVDFVNASSQLKDPLEQSMQEISAQVSNVLSNCDTTASYLLFGNENNITTWDTFNTQFKHTRIKSMKIYIEDVQVMIPQTEQIPLNEDQDMTENHCDKNFGFGDSQFHEDANLGNDTSSNEIDSI